MIARFCPGNELADTVMKALAAGGAGQGLRRHRQPQGHRVLRPPDEPHWVHMEILEGSYGGRYGKDGMDAVDTLYANTRNNPIEDIESHLPLRVTRYELREDVAGAGEWRGGLGSVREFAFLTDGGFSVEGDGHRYRPWGFLGGSDGMPAELDLVAGGTTRALPSKVPHMNIAKDGRFVCYGPAGGGYGNPLERDPAKVSDDVLDGVISVETAKRPTMASWYRLKALSTTPQPRKSALTASSRQCSPVAARINDDGIVTRSARHDFIYPNSRKQAWRRYVRRRPKKWHHRR